MRGHWMDASVAWVHAEAVGEAGPAVAHGAHVTLGSQG